MPVSCYFQDCKVLLVISLTRVKSAITRTEFQQQRQRRTDSIRQWQIMVHIVLLQLLGQIDIDTREWSDGVLTYAARQVVKEPQNIQSWIVCDGDIDPEWIESLNSVLDDNRLLTMPSGERIQFGPNVNFVFETHDLSCASPATVSRMGMIFLRSNFSLSQLYTALLSPVCIDHFALNFKRRLTLSLSIYLLQY